MNQDAILLLTTYAVQGMRAAFPAIQLTEENLPAVQAIFDEQGVTILEDRFLFVLKDETSSAQAIGTWAVFSDNEAAPFKDGVVFVNKQDFMKRFTVTVNDPRSFLEKFTELTDGLVKDFHQMVAEGLVAEDTDEEGLLHLLADSIQSSDGNPEHMKRIAIVSLMLYLNGDYNPGQFLAAHASKDEEDLPR